MNNHFLDGERVKAVERGNSLDIQYGDASASVSILRHYTLTDVNDSATYFASDTLATQLCLLSVPHSQGEAA